MTAIKQICLFSLLFIKVHLYGDNVIVLSQQLDDYFLHNTKNLLSIFEDPSNTLTANQIIQNKKNNFINHSDINGSLYIKNPSSTYWLKFKIKTNKQTEQKWVLENLDSHIDFFELYQVANNQITQIGKAGYTLPFNIRNYQHKNFIFDLNIDTTATTYLIKVKSSIHNPLFIKIRSTRFFSYYATNEYYLLGLYYGILIIMAIYNLMIFFSIKEKIYLYFVTYVLCGIILSLAEDGLGYQYLWPQFPKLNYWVAKLSPLLLTVSFIFYSQRFLDLTIQLPKVNTLLNAINSLYITYFLFDLLVLKTERAFPLYIIPFVIIYFSAIKCLQKGLRQARYFIIGYSFMFASILMLILRMSGITHWENLISIYSFNISLVIEIVVLSFALGDRLKIMKETSLKAQQETIEQLKINEQLKDKVNQELEERVSQRTIELEKSNKEVHQKSMELEKANQRLNEQAEEINRMNLLLDIDNRKLQKNIKDLEKSRVLMQGIDYEEFKKTFSDRTVCLKYLYELKWDESYECKKCGHNKWCKGRDKYSRRCTKCRYDESSTAFTIFHKLKFDIVKAFYIVFLIYGHKGKITSKQIAEDLDMRLTTCWAFSKKVRETLEKKIKAGEITETDGWASLVKEEQP